jgi:hypothetical protein
MYSFVPPLACNSLVWTLLLLALNLAWEFAQLPLYSLGTYEGWPRSAYAVLHCTLGDAGIALGSYALAAALVRRVDWPMRRPAMGIAIATSVALAYTVWAEWRNVYLVGNWAYAGSMPTIGGIGVAPLLQWIALPLVALRLIRRAGRRRPFCRAR